jgi:hypothetical protein
MTPRSIEKWLDRGGLGRQENLLARADGPCIAKLASLPTRDPARAASSRRRRSGGRRPTRGRTRRRRSCGLPGAGAAPERRRHDQSAQRRRMPACSLTRFSRDAEPPPKRDHPRPRSRPRAPPSPPASTSAVAKRSPPRPSRLLLERYRRTLQRKARSPINRLRATRLTTVHTGRLHFDRLRWLIDDNVAIHVFDRSSSVYSPRLARARPISVDLKERLLPGRT